MHRTCTGSCPRPGHAYARSRPSRRASASSSRRQKQTWPSSPVAWAVPQAPQVTKEAPGSGRTGAKRDLRAATRPRAARAVFIERCIFRRSDSGRPGLARGASTTARPDGRCEPRAAFATPAGSTGSQPRRADLRLGDPRPRGMGDLAIEVRLTARAVLEADQGTVVTVRLSAAVEPVAGVEVALGEHAQHSQPSLRGRA